MDEHRCPRCNGFSVQRTDQRFAEVTVVELTCSSCKLYEERRSDARDFSEWRERWRGRPTVPIYDYDSDLLDVD
jgi:hypothetical protein